MQECPKCHEMIGKGFYQHTKWCDGIPKPTKEDPKINENVTRTEGNKSGSLSETERIKYEKLSSKINSIESKLDSKTDEIDEMVNKTEKIEANLNDLASIQGLTFVDDDPNSTKDQEEHDPEPDNTEGVISGMSAIWMAFIVIMLVLGLLYLAFRYLTSKAITPAKKLLDVFETTSTSNPPITLS